MFALSATPAASTSPTSNIFSAPTNCDGVLLVNGTPPFIDVDDDKITAREEYSGAVKRKYPDATIWPADRYHTNLPTEQSSGAGQTFEVEYLLLKGCHACERLGTVVIAFDFDSSGRFLKTQIVKVATEAKTSSVAWPDQRRDTDDYVTPMQIHSKVGDSFTIPLEANHTTGYSWRLAQPARSGDP